MNFCHVINDRYVNNLIVLMSSIFENCKGDHCFYILSNGLKNENEKKIQQFAEKNFSKVFLIMVDDSCLKNVPKTSTKHRTISCYFLYYFLKM